MKINLSILFIVFIFFVAMVPSAELRASPQTVELMAEEAEEDLQAQAGTTWQEVMAAFKQKGGTFVRLEANSASYQLHPGDTVYPVCSGGFCRSQTLWALLRPYADKINLFPPYAARYGYDPYNGKVNWHRNTKEAWYDEYELWATVPKAQRFGFDVFASLQAKDNATAEELSEITAFYDAYYFGPNSSQQGQQRLYFTFDKNSHVVMHRLNQTNERLDTVVVVHLAFKDLMTHPLPEWNTFPRSTITYDNFSKMITPLIDLSLLNK